MLQKKAVFAFVSMSVVLSTINCSSSGGGGASSILSSYFPSSVAVASFTESQSSSFMGLRDLNIFSPDSTDTMAEKKAKLEELVTSSSSCSVNIQITSSGNANCYGPSLDYSGHPDGAPASGTFPGGDLGIINPSTGGEACTAAQMNSRIRGVASNVDSGMFAMASLFCAAAKSGAALPVENGTLDLTTEMAGNVSINGSPATVNSASLSRAADATDGRPVFVSTYNATIGTTTYDIRLKHAPNESDLTQFRGKLSIKMSFNDSTKPGNCGPSTATGYTNAYSIAYEQTATTSVTYELQSAQFCGYDADPWVSSSVQTVDFSKKYSGGTPRGWGNDGNYILANGNPTASTGTMLYAWQAGMNDGNTRVFDVTIANTGSTIGTSFFGFGPDIQVGTNRGIAEKMICNWAGPGNSHTGISEVQKQVMTLTSGVFVETTSNIIYDPNNACESASGTFVLSGTVDGAAFSRDASTTTKDLVPASEVLSTITVPSIPADVDL